MSAPVDTGALRELLEKATPGGWKVVIDINGRSCIQGAGSYSVADFYQAPAGDARSTAELVALTFNALPALLAEVERRRADEAELVSMLQRWNALDGGSWNVDRHARDKAELKSDTRSLLAKVKDSGSLSPRSFDNRDRSST